MFTKADCSIRAISPADACPHCPGSLGDEPCGKEWQWHLICRVPWEKGGLLFRDVLGALRDLLEESEVSGGSGKTEVARLPFYRGACQAFVFIFSLHWGVGGKLLFHQGPGKGEHFVLEREGWMRSVPVCWKLWVEEGWIGAPRTNVQWWRIPVTAHSIWHRTKKTLQQESSGIKHPNQQSAGLKIKQIRLRILPFPARSHSWSRSVRMVTYWLRI